MHAYRFSFFSEEKQRNRSPTRKCIKYWEHILGWIKISSLFWKPPTVKVVTGNANTYKQETTTSLSTVLTITLWPCFAAPATSSDCHLLHAACMCLPILIHASTQGILIARQGSASNCCNRIILQLLHWETRSFHFLLYSYVSGSAPTPSFCTAKRSSRNIEGIGTVCAWRSLKTASCCRCSKLGPKCVGTG